MELPIRMDVPDPAAAEAFHAAATALRRARRSGDGPIGPPGANVPMHGHDATTPT